MIGLFLNFTAIIGPNGAGNRICVYSRANPGEMYEAIEQADRVL